MLIPEPQFDGYAWDKNKNAANIAKHEISFEDAIQIFQRPEDVLIEDAKSQREPRFQATGTLAGEEVVVVIYTVRDNSGRRICRVISARQASRKERKRYADYRRVH